MAVLDNQVYKLVEWRLYHYHALRHQAEDLANERETLLNPGRTPASPGGGGVSHRSDPTATNTLRRLRLGSQQQAAAKWVEVIEHTIERYQDETKGMLLELQYFSDMAADYICERLKIERATYFNWRTELVTFTALVAVQYGLMDVINIKP